MLRETRTLPWPWMGAPAAANVQAVLARNLRLVSIEFPESFTGGLEIPAF
jgi:hypothetical protein